MNTNNIKEIKRGDVMEVTVPSVTGEVKIVACVLEAIDVPVWREVFEVRYIMYSQNRLFRMSNVRHNSFGCDNDGCPIKETTMTPLSYEGVIADYVVIPDVDEKLNSLLSLEK